MHKNAPHTTQDGDNLRKQLQRSMALQQKPHKCPIQV